MTFSELFSNKEILNFKESKPLLLVSGGPDSIYLFHQFLNGKLEYAIDFDVVHFNHNLRGAESNREQSFVQSLCDKHKIKCHIIQLKFKEKSSIQVKARKARHRECFKLNKLFGYKTLVTAHHKDDLFETLIMRISRGAGLKGLTGIKRISILNKSVHVLRPLLNLSKSEILNELNNDNKEYCLDSSNLKKDYFRNRVRLDILHSWKSDDHKSNVIKNCSVLQIADDYFENRLHFLCKKYPRFIPLNIWDSWPQELQFRFFTVKMNQKGFKQQVDTRHYQLIQKDIVKLELNRACFFKDSSGCYFYSKNELSQLRLQNFPIHKSGSYYIGHMGKIFSLNLENLNQANPLFVTSAQLNEFYIDKTKNRKISLKKLFQSHRIPIYQRRFWPVLRDHNRQIVAVFGLD